MNVNRGTFTALPRHLGLYNEMCYTKISLNTLFRNMALAMVFLNNANYGAAASLDGVELLMPNAEELVAALQERKSLRDPDLLQILRLFEEVTTGVKT